MFERNFRKDRIHLETGQSANVQETEQKAEKVQADGEQRDKQIWICYLHSFDNPRGDQAPKDLPQIQTDQSFRRENQPNEE